MNSSSNPLAQLARSARSHATGFERVVAFDYYDGPERGLAIFASGYGVRFSSIADSPSKLFRAFLLEAIGGDWLERIRSLPEYVAAPPTALVILPRRQSKVLTKLEQDVFASRTINSYVAVGASHLDRLSLAPVSKSELIDIQALGGSPAAFRAAHRVIKSKRMSKGTR